MSGAHRPDLADPRLLALELHVARRMRLRRLEMGLTQSQLAELMNVTYQQVHKYENGINRITAARLHTAALALSVDVTFFYEQAEFEPVGTSQNDLSRRLVELTSNVLQIADPQKQHALCRLARALAATIDATAG